MNQKNLFSRSALAIAVAIVSSNAGAAGFLLNEYSTSALGRAFSGAGAMGDNASEGSRNPAAMMLFDRPSLSIGAVYIDPSVDIKGRDNDIFTSNNIAPNALVPNAHFIFPVNDKWAVGTSMTTNFGLATDFPKNYAGGPVGGKTDLKTVNLNLSGAYRLNDNFSFGLGVNAVYADAEITRHLGVSAKQLAPFGVTSSTTAAKLEGDDWGYGWNAGLLYEINQDNRLSFTYRSKVKVKFENGKYTNDIPKHPLLKPLNPMGGETVKGTLDLNLPDIWEFSGYHKVAPKWALHYSVAYTGWSEFKELTAYQKSDGKELFHKPEHFKDAWRLALGTTYFYDDNWTFRTGIAYDQTPVRAEYRSISIPDQDRYWLSAGSTYAFNENTSVDVGIAYMHGKKVNINEMLKEGDPSTTTRFKSEGSAWLYGVNFNYTF
ncbi:long-chain fatty acid transporter FadL [Providencia hangzhouensis]|uniref:Long-chain fatty acid transport protein n=2 Tax=Providencia TaxID=586 RepID=A0A264VNC8_PRORE|nr:MULTISPECIES: long-chain fatty acid transporter FadL [Providencia]MBN6365153.1 long-chain fatty acid transporter FadL [Providencia rettgeri]MBQ0265102.1 long-chain fatty acid transporter FadL [Providencia rettgeri]MBQ0370635.1 long-chain fatty acid transporter FadL [Providencia rettgeri]MBQ0528707.1 long-chain fatty acid transporter FadL [Providencia rettgeri]MBT0661738.1 long-chain fatty acid transporter FadL [Providencia rettgeri]